MGEGRFDLVYHHGLRQLDLQWDVAPEAAFNPAEVLVSSTVKDLVAGSGITFRERGEHELKGVPDPWRLFAAEV